MRADLDELARAAAARPAWIATAAVVVVLAGSAVAGWSAHWPPAVFGAAAHKAAAAPAWGTLNWTAAEAPMPAGTISELTGVACPDTNACVVGGGYTDQDNNVGIVLERVSHHQWVPTIYKPGSTVGYGVAPANAVACPVPGTCVTGGEYSDLSAKHQAALVTSFSAGTWTASHLSLPLSAGRDQEMEIDGIACPAPGICIAVGDNYRHDVTTGERQAMIQTLRDGTWTAAEAPLPADAADGDKADGLLNGIACSAPGSCIAVGGYRRPGGDLQGLVETLANGTWTPSAVPRSGSALTAVSCPAAGSCLAVSAAGLVETLANRTWTTAAIPLPKDADGAYLAGVACPAEGSCVIVGDYFTGKDAARMQALMEILVNRSWIPARIPLPDDAMKPGQSAALSAVACATAGYCVAAGSYEDSGKHPQALIESTLAP